MKWKKKGLIYAPSAKAIWMMKYGMMPTPIHLPELGVIRIFFGTTTSDNFGQTTFIDVSEDNPAHQVYIEENEPTISLGQPGTFDDCGAIPSSVLKVDDKFFLYYVGFQRCFKVPFMLFPGLATSANGIAFKKFSQSPLIDRTAEHFFSFAAPFVMNENEIFKMWLWVGREWVKVNNKDYLKASIGYAESNDGIHWNFRSSKCIVPNGQNEFSVGRPWVVKQNGKFKMFYSVRHVKTLYRLGYAESKDGIDWIRKDDEIGIDVSASGWDSEMICYPAVIAVKNRTYLFYNGNNNGETGFGWAELISD